MVDRERLLGFALQAASRRVVAHERQWREMWVEKSRQVEEGEYILGQVLKVCAASETGTVDVEDIYRILSGVRQR